MVLPYRNIALVLPIFLILGAKLTHAILTTFNVFPNPLKSDVTFERTAIAFPDEPNNLVPNAPGSSTVCAILLGLVSHSPMGMLAQSFKETGDRFDVMCDELSADATKYGFLGASSWINSERSTRNEVAVILYFENEEYLHAYAHGPMHTEAMVWWADVQRKGKTTNVGIMHEVFACPKKHWEGIYLNYHPTGLASTTKEYTTKDGEKKWVSPVVKGKGKLCYSKGRMGRDFGEKEWVEFGQTLSAEEKAELAY